MKTSYYAKSGSNPNAVGISRGVPKWYQGKIYKPLAPPWELVKVTDEVLFRDIYHKRVLSKLNPQQVMAALGENAVMLCWEKTGEFCHRRLVAEWLEKALGISVPELT